MPGTSLSLLDCAAGVPAGEAGTSEGGRAGSVRADKEQGKSGVGRSSFTTTTNRQTPLPLRPRTPLRYVFAGTTLFGEPASPLPSGHASNARPKQNPHHHYHPPSDRGWKGPPTFWHLLHPRSLALGTWFAPGRQQGRSAFFSHQRSGMKFPTHGAPRRRRAQPRATTTVENERDDARSAEAISAARAGGRRGRERVRGLPTTDRDSCN